MVQAQQRLNRHIRHYPPAAINKALDDAEDIICYWADRNSWGEEIRQDRYNRMWGAAEWQWDVGPANSARSIATFPEIVALASIILSSSWRREVALSVGFYGAKRHFIGKLGRRLNIERFDPGGAWDHLLTWIDNRQREYARYCRARKLLVGDPDGLAELDRYHNPLRSDWWTEPPLSALEPPHYRGSALWRARYAYLDGYAQPPPENGTRVR